MTTESASRPTRVTYVGHGTVLVEMDGVRILTDPSLRRWTGALRRYGPLPDPAVRHHLDAVLISHLHLDHLTPRSVGGADVATNLVLACRSCNSRRHDLSLAAWSLVAGTHLRFTARSIRAQARRRLPEAA